MFVTKKYLKEVFFNISRIKKRTIILTKKTENNYNTSIIFFAHVIIFTRKFCCGDIYTRNNF